MRRFVACVLSAALLLPAFAMATGATPVAAPNASSMPPTPPDAAQIEAMKASQAMQKQEIGYDAKAKRDPYGKVIDETKNGQAPAAAPKKLRNDRVMRSDKERFNPKAATKQAAKPTYPPPNQPPPGTPATLSGQR